MANWKNFQKLRDFLATLPEEQIRMETLLCINRDKETVKEAIQPSCGTVGCIAGWGALLFSEPSEEITRTNRSRFGNVNPHFDAYEITATALDLELSLAEDTDEQNYVFCAGWHLEKDWTSGAITKAEVLAYLDKAIASRDVMVRLEPSNPAGA